jgi:hypothetical protein
MSVDVFTLRGVDYSERGTQTEIVVAGQSRPQTVIYAVLDYQGEKCYYTEEGHRYILDSRRSRTIQRFTVNYLDRIPRIIRHPIGIGKDLGQMQTVLYFGEIAIEEHAYRKRLFVVVVKEGLVKVIWNFYWLENARIPDRVKLVYRTNQIRRYVRKRKKHGL